MRPRLSPTDFKNATAVIYLQITEAGRSGPGNTASRRKTTNKMQPSYPRYVYYGILFPCCLFAPERSPAEWSINARGTTNYIHRSYTKSDNAPSAQLNLDFEHETGLFAGTTLATVDFADNGYGDRSFLEIAPYLGFSWPLNDAWQVEAQYLRYIFNGAVFGHDVDYNEYYFFLHYLDVLTAQISFSEDFWNQNAAASDYQLIARYPLTDSLRISSGIGYGLYRSALEYDYAYWNLGLTYFMKHVAFDLRYADSVETAQKFNEHHDDEDHLELKQVDPTAVFSISIGF